jgi:hypothetical protein
VAEPSALECFLPNPPEIVPFDQCYITSAVDVVFRYKKELEVEFFGSQLGIFAPLVDFKHPKHVRR